MKVNILMLSTVAFLPISSILAAENLEQPLGRVIPIQNLEGHQADMDNIADFRANGKSPSVEIGLTRDEIALVEAGTHQINWGALNKEENEDLEGIPLQPQRIIPIQNSEGYQADIDNIADIRANGKSPSTEIGLTRDEIALVEAGTHQINWSAL